jgi:hypothetical protein
VIDSYEIKEAEQACRIEVKTTQFVPL